MNWTCRDIVCDHVAFCHDHKTCYVHARASTICIGLPLLLIVRVPFFCAPSLPHDHAPFYINPCIHSPTPSQLEILSVGETYFDT